MGLVVNFAKDLDTPLLKLSPWDSYSARDACAGLHFWGRTGAGKTTAAHVLAGACLSAGMGGYVTAVKPDTVTLWQRYAAEHGRSLILFDENEGFNFLDYELARQGMDGVGTVTECLMRVIDAAKRASATASHHGGEAFWEDAPRETLRYTIPPLYAADGSVTIPGIIRFISAAPASPKDPTSAEWQQRSFMYKKMQAALCEPKVPMSKAALSHAVTFWSERWAGMPEKTRGNVVATITATLDRFNHGRLNRVFCGKTTIVPELSFGGGVIVDAKPTTTWNEDGVIAQQIFKFFWQRAVLSRNSLAEKHRERFLFLWCDEGQETVHPQDGDFLGLGRDSKCCTVYLSQSLPAYIAKIGGDNPKDAALNLAGKFSSHVFCSNSCPETNEFASRMIGKIVTRHGNYSNGTSRSVNVGMNASNSENSGSSSSYGYGAHLTISDGSNSGAGSSWGSNRGRSRADNVSRGYSESIEYAIEPGDFARVLRTGGPQNGNIVTGVWFQSGRVFKASGTNFLLGRFAQ